MGVPITALVFDRLSPEARQVAMKAAKTYLGDKKETPNYMGVFGIDLQSQVLHAVHAKRRGAAQGHRQHRQPGVGRRSASTRTG